MKLKQMDLSKKSQALFYKAIFNINLYNCLALSTPILNYWELDGVSTFEKFYL